jgi:hypothetical protein
MTAEHELDSYPPETSSSQPTSSLLDQGPPARRHQRPPQLRRYWKPLAIIGVPLILILIYSAIHPHVEGLPALPAIHVGDRPAAAAAGEHPCVCGSGSGEGARLCEAYGEPNLIASRLYEGSGARVRRMLAKAREGKAVKIGILGGSGEYLEL